MEKIKNFKDLKICQLSMDVVDNVYNVLKRFPKEEMYALANQMRRSAISMPSNIAEGFARKSNKEYKQFLYVVLGSAAELETQIEIARRQKYMADDTAKTLTDNVVSVAKMTNVLISKL